MFDSLGKRSLVGRLSTNMSGSVICSETKGNKKRKVAAVKAAPKKSAKTKAKAKAAAGSTHEPELPAEHGILDTTVTCNKGVRQKVWLDDLVGAVNHTTQSLRTIASFGSIADEEFDSLKQQLVRIGLLFAFKGQIMLPGANGKPGKVFKKWSALRPALQTHGVHLLVQARWFWV